MDPSTMRTLGRNGIEVTQLVQGCAQFDPFSRQVPEAGALAAITAAWDAGTATSTRCPGWPGSVGDPDGRRHAVSAAGQVRPVEPDPSC